MNEPLAYIVVSGRDDGVIASGPTLRATVSGLDGPGVGFGWYVNALVGTERIVVPKAAYAEPDSTNHEEALSFIRKRAARIAAAIAAGRNPSMERLYGCARCDCDDPEEKQIADYIATAAWKLRAEPDETWWLAEGETAAEAAP